MLQIKFFSVNCADCIWIRFIGNDAKWHNILIDGGFSSTFRRTIVPEVQRMEYAGERLDVLVVTHTDSDHIGGILNFIKRYGDGDWVDWYWFNDGQPDIELPDGGSAASIRQGETLKGFLSKSGRWVNHIVADQEPIDLFGAKITFLSPRPVDLCRLETYWTDSLTKSGWEKTADVNTDYTQTVAELMTQPLPPMDDSPPNMTSIAFLFEIEEVRVLFTADTNSSVLTQELRELGFSETNKLPLNLMKLPHHGSKFNINDELLTFLDCSNFVISANGIQHGLPHKTALVRVICKHGRVIREEPIHFHFTHQSPSLQSIFTADEMYLYNIAPLNFPESSANSLIFNF